MTSEEWQFLIYGLPKEEQEGDSCKDFAYCIIAAWIIIMVLMYYGVIVN